MPAREMLADLLLEIKKPREALAEYKGDLKFNPKRFDGVYGAAQAAEMVLYAGDRHLFADPGLESFDLEAAAQLTERVLRFLDALDHGAESE